MLDTTLGGILDDGRRKFQCVNAQTAMLSWCALAELVFAVGRLTVENTSIKNETTIERSAHDCSVNLRKVSRCSRLRFEKQWREACEP